MDKKPLPVRLVSLFILQKNLDDDGGEVENITRVDLTDERYLFDHLQHNKFATTRTKCQIAKSNDKLIKPGRFEHCTNPVPLRFSSFVQNTVPVV